MNCPVCNVDLDADPAPAPGGIDAVDYRCQRCGKYRLSGTPDASLQSYLTNAKQRAVLSHAIRRLSESQRMDGLATTFVERVLENEALPSPAEQVDNLVLWLGDTLDSAGAQTHLRLVQLPAVVGAVEPNDVDWALREIRHAGWITTAPKDVAFSVSLTLRGWQEYESLRRGRAHGHNAFMAMPFGDDQLDAVYRDCFKPAAADAGFSLVRVDEEPRAGLIDSRIRAEIRASRFLIAELTEANLGAYWEAGFAEGLGKPVIYTCRSDYFEAEGTHFDTNHHHTVVWAADELGRAADDLRATIRATLPTLATFEGEEA